MAKRPYIVGNWKMNGSRAMLAEARAIDRIAARQPGVLVALAPPAPLINPMNDAAETMIVGAQDCHYAASGAHTGDVSAAMLKDAGAAFTIVGHSERRASYGETDAQVRAKAEAALAAGLGVILCVGESEATRDAGQAEAFVVRQLADSLPEADAVPDKLDVAYEPVWAIGTGRTPSLDEVAAMHDAIRTLLEDRYGEAGADMRVLYGGSVNPDNAADLLAIAGVAGALVGGASLTADSFGSIIVAAATSDESD